MLLTWYAPILVFPSVFERVPVRCSPRGNTFLPEVAFARGPVNEGQTGAGTLTALFSRVWALVWRRAGDLELYQLEAGAWFQRNPLGGLPVLAETARHVSLAFDQSGRPVIAWEDSGEVFVRQWDGAAFAVRGGFAGVDPLLMCDAVLLREIPGSDVVLFHLSADRLEVKSRIQNTVYAVASDVATLNEASFLDQMLFRGPQFDLILETLTGSEFALRSDLYPFTVFDPLVTARVFNPAAGSYDPVVIVRDLSSDNLTTATALPPAVGAYEPVVIVRDLGSDNLTTATALPPAVGAYEPAVLVQNLGTDVLTAATVSAPSGGSYGP